MGRRNSFSGVWVLWKGRGFHSFGTVAGYQRYGNGSRLAARLPHKNNAYGTTACMPCVYASVPSRLGLLAPRHVGPLPLLRLLLAWRGSAAAQVNCRQKEWIARRRRENKIHIANDTNFQPVAWKSVFEYLLLPLPFPAICQFGTPGDKAVKVRVRRWLQRRRQRAGAAAAGVAVAATAAAAVAQPCNGCGKRREATL